MKGQFASMINIGLATIASFLGGYTTPILIIAGILVVFIIFAVVRNSGGSVSDTLDRAQKRETEYIKNEAANVEKKKEQDIEEAEEEFEEDLEDPPDDLGSAIDSQIEGLRERYEK